MTTWVAMAVVAAVVLAVIIYGALADRRRNQREAALMQQPPDRDIPKFSPEQAAPHYLSDLEARRTAVPRQPNAEQRQRFTEVHQVATPIPAGYASEAFITDSQTGWAALSEPDVVLCIDPVTRTRELMPVLERALSRPHALVIVAPAFAEEVVRTVEVNVLQGLAEVLLIIAEPEGSEAILAATGARGIEHLDLQSGYLPDDAIGHASTWISAKTQTWIS